MGNVQYEDDLYDDEEDDDEAEEEAEAEAEWRLKHTPPKEITEERVAGIDQLKSIAEVEQLIGDIDANLRLLHQREQAEIRLMRLEYLKKAHRAPRCTHIKCSGETCESPAIKNEMFCWYHKLPALCGPYELPFIEDPRSYQVAMMRVCHQISNGRVKPRQARMLLKAVAMAGENMKHGKLDSGNG
jgi:hypothetical protein